MLQPVVLLGEQFVELLLESLAERLSKGTSGEMVDEFSLESDDDEKLDLRTKRTTKARKTPRRRSL